MEYGKEIDGNKIWSALVMLLTMCLLLWGQQGAEAAGFAQRAGSMSEITGIRVSTDADKTRIVVDGTKETEYKVSVISNPQRIIIDIQNAWISPNVKKSTTIDSRFAKAVRIAQHDSSTVRVVVESSMGKNNYKVFALKGGTTAYRVVMDFGKVGGGSKNSGIDFNPQPKPDTSGSNNTNKGETVETTPSGTTPSGTTTEPVFTPGLKGKIIALDAGHGGSDSGAIGPTGVSGKGRYPAGGQGLAEAVAGRGGYGADD